MVQSSDVEGSAFGVSGFTAFRIGDLVLGACRLVLCGTPV